jgi:hypothetical protein
MKKHIISIRELKRARTAKAIVGAVKDFISRGMLLTLILAPAAQAANLDINDAVEGLGVPDPVGSIGIEGLFRDPITAAPVAIPSNLTVQFVGNDDNEECGNGEQDDTDDGDG